MKCHCGSRNTFDACCKPLLERLESAASAEALMRSRYSAFCTQDMDYLRDTTHPSTRASFDLSANTQWAHRANFERLEILSASEEADTGSVVFKAYFRIDGALHVHSESSVFRREQGTWYFVEGH